MSHLCRIPPLPCPPAELLSLLEDFDGDWEAVRGICLWKICDGENVKHWLQVLNLVGQGFLVGNPAAYLVLPQAGEIHTC
jgi:hypothetical protein